MNSGSQAAFRRQCRAADRPWGHIQSSSKHGSTHATAGLPSGTHRPQACFLGLAVWSACGHHSHIDGQLTTQPACPALSGTQTKEREVVSRKNGGDDPVRDTDGCSRSHTGAAMCSPARRPPGLAQELQH